MERTIKKITLFVFLTSSFTWFYCGDDANPLAPKELAGSWTFVSLTNKIDNITISAGDQADIGGMTGIITGTLELTETTFTFTFTISATGIPPQSLAFSGTYSISGSTLTAIVSSSTVPDIEVGTNTFTISRSGDRMTFEDDESKWVYDKQE
ncbi:MAG: hypothetical protein ACE5HS_11390 [bacterium]